MLPVSSNRRTSSFWRSGERETSHTQAAKAFVMVVDDDDDGKGRKGGSNTGWIPGCGWACGVALGLVIGVVFMGWRCNAHIAHLTESVAHDLRESGHPSPPRTLRSNAYIAQRLTAQVLPRADDAAVAEPSLLGDGTAGEPSLLGDGTAGEAGNVDYVDGAAKPPAAPPPKRRLAQQRPGPGMGAPVRRGGKAGMKPVMGASMGPVAKGPVANGSVDTAGGSSRRSPMGPQYPYPADCKISNGKQSDTGPARRFDMVLLSSFPRSGNSWTRLLLHGGNQYMDRGLATTQMELLGKVFQMSTCKTCPDKAIAAYIRHDLNVVPDSNRKGNQAELREIYGINRREASAPVAADDDACAALYNMRTRLPNWESLRPPVLIKSHFPFIGEPGVEEFTRKFNKIIHLTRNPFDNVASRFLGNSHKFQDRWDALLAARAKNKTTPVFDAFVKSDVKAYVRFHRYWLQRRATDMARGVSTLYVRYESLCANTDAIASAMIKFGGWDLTRDTLDCTLAESPCVADVDAMPNHMSIYNDEQIQLVLKAAEDVLNQLGYEFGPGSKMRLAMPKLPMCN